MTRTIMGVKLPLTPRELHLICEADRKARWALKKEQAKCIS